MNSRLSKKNIIAAGALVFMMACAVGLLLAEAVVRCTDVDWRFVKKNLSIAMADIPNHIPDPDPELLLRLRPGSSYTYGEGDGAYRVNINSLGVRGPEREVKKPEGVFRIVCLGGSNVYGACVNDDETWPAQLEQALNLRNPGKFEVWNLGISAYVPSQMVVLAEESLAKYDPDLLILGMSNQGAPAFHPDSDLDAIFREKPDYWFRLVSRDAISECVFPLSETKTWLLQHVRLYRLGLLAVAEADNKDKAPLWHMAGWFDWNNEFRMREFLKKNASLSVLFFGPYIDGEIVPGANWNRGNPTLLRMMRIYGAGELAPSFQLSADGKPDEYKDIHPPARVYAWYAEELAAWLMENDRVSIKRATVTGIHDR